MDSNTDIRFVIFNAPRVGSNMLCTMLDSHPGILCHQEIFNPNIIGVARSVKNEPTFHLATLEEREQSPESVLSSVWKINHGNRVIGFKLCWRQHDIYRIVLEDPTVKKIILKRENRLRSYVSLLLARKTADWVIYNQSSLSLKESKVKVDVDDLWKVLEYNRAYYQELETTMLQSGQEWFECWYETLSNFTTKKQILDYLEVPNPSPNAMIAGTRQINPRPISELVENFEQLVEALKGTELEGDLFD